MVHAREPALLAKVIKCVAVNGYRVVAIRLSCYYWSVASVGSIEANRRDWLEPRELEEVDMSSEFLADSCMG